MTARSRWVRTLGATLALATLFAAAPLRADEGGAESEVGTPAPAPEPTTPAEPETSGPAETMTPETATPETPLAARPIDAVHRPTGFWGPVAVAADVLVMRPVAFVSLAAAGAAFVVVSPVAAATGTLGDRVDALRDRAQNVFTRPLGAL